MDKKQELELLNSVKEKIKSNDVLINMFKKHGVNIDYLDLFPMAFSDSIDVSARTDHGVIYFNAKLLEKPDQLDHYMIHELSHVAQQCFRNSATQGANDGDYLDNKFEQEGFRNQTEYLSETRSPEVAEEYIDKVLDHHDVDSKKEREKRKKKLLQLSDK
jgi:hypothetical protein